MHDRAFVAKIASAYEAQLVPHLFEPYADDLVERIATLDPKDVLELAAGTGAVTRALLKRLPSAHVVATDLNQAMLDVASHAVHNPNVTFEIADGSDLRYADRSFDAVVSQFGVMFFGDKDQAFRHVHRVLRPEGTFLFSVWDMLVKNPLPNTIAKAYHHAVGQPCFLERVPFSMWETPAMETQLKAAGFSNVQFTRVTKETKFHSAAGALDAYISGSPLSEDFNLPGMGRGAQVREACFEALEAQFGDGEITNLMTAIVIEAKS